MDSPTADVLEQGEGILSVAMWMGAVDLTDSVMVGRGNDALVAANVVLGGSVKCSCRKNGDWVVDLCSTLARRGEVVEVLESIPMSLASLSLPG